MDDPKAHPRPVLILPEGTTHNGANLHGSDPYYEDSFAGAKGYYEAAPIVTTANGFLELWFLDLQVGTNYSRFGQPEGRNNNFTEADQADMLNDLQTKGVQFTIEKYDSATPGPTRASPWIRLPLKETS